MKHLILISFMLGAVSAQAQQKQSLKDLLYGGKLKKDSSGVIHSTDDLSAKIDTTTKKEPEVVKTSAPVAPPTAKPDRKADNQKTDAAMGTDVVSTTADASNATTPAPANVPAKTNTKIWKEYTDSLTKVLKAEVFNSKQVKKNTYFLLVDYDLAPDGSVTVTNVSSTPENAYLQAQVKQIMDSTPLRLNPVGDASNPTKKLKRRQQITVTKD